MGAAKVQFESIRAGVLGALDHAVPGLAGRFNHQRRDYGMVWITLLHFVDLAQIRLNGTVTNELDVIQAHHAVAVPIHRRVPRRDVDDGLPDGLPDRAAPTCVEGAHDLFAAVGRRSGSEPEWVGAVDAGEAGG